MCGSGRCTPTHQKKISLLLFFASYDVWLVDWRTSCNLLSLGHGNYTLDDCAAYDYPAAINKVIEVTKQV